MIRLFGCLRRLLATAVVIGLAAAAPPPAAAECDGPPVSYRTYASSAPTVVIGRVSAIDSGRIDPDADDPGRSTGFTLAVQSVLRGTAGQTLDLVDVRSGPCSAPLAVRVGDRIAIASGLQDRLFFGDETWAAVAWIEGEPPAWLAEVERLSVAEVFRVLGLDPPDTSVVPVTSPPAAGLTLACLLTALVTLVVLRSNPPGRVRSPGERP